MIVFQHGIDKNNNAYTFLGVEYNGVLYLIHNHKFGSSWWVDNYFFNPDNLPKCKEINQLEECYELVHDDIRHSITRPEDSVFTIIKEKVEAFNDHIQPRNK